MERKHMTRMLRVLVLVAAGSVYCVPPPPQIFIDTPAHGAFINAASTVVTGHVANSNLATVQGQVSVNGVNVTVNPDLTFSTTVSLDSTKVFNGITATLFPTFPNPERARITVIAGQGIAEGSLSSKSVALRINDTGLDTLEPLITSLVPLNLATLLPPGTLIIDNYCYASIFGACIGRVDVTVAPSPPPSIGSYTINADSLALNDVRAVVTLNNLFVRANVVAVSGIGFTCHFNISATSATITGDYNLSPLASQPSDVDVTQNANVSVGTIGFSDGGGADCDGFFGGLVAALIGIFVPDIQGLVTSGLVNFLADPDGGGPADSPIAAAIQTALSNISISGPIGNGIGVTLETPLFKVDEDASGITLGSNTRMTILPAEVDPNAYDPTASYVVPGIAFPGEAGGGPAYGATTPTTGSPAGALPYGVAIGISPTAFNQLLRTQIEGGLLLTSLTQLDLFGSGPVPITSTILSLFEPRFALLGLGVPLTLVIKPLLAPVITAAAVAPPNDAELRAGHLVIDVMGPPGVGLVVSFIVDARVFLDIGFTPAAGATPASLNFALSPPALADIAVQVVKDSLEVNEANIGLILPPLIQALFPSLASSLASFPLPEFLGLNLSLVKITKQGEFISLYTNLVP
jgi:hypothetical protein